jgi:hypothetical protein
MKKVLSLIGVFLITSACFTQDVLEQVPDEWRSAVNEALQKAGENKPALIRALEETKDPEELRIVAFCIAQSAYRYFGGIGQETRYDCTTLSAELLLKNARLALETRRKEYPWAQRLDDDKFLRFVCAYRNETEQVFEFREYVKAFDDLKNKVDEYACLYRDAVSDNRRIEVFKEMVYFINTVWFAKKVKYQPRGMPDLNLKQLLEQGWGRCTDLTNGLIAILRTFGVAATGARAIWWAKEDSNHLWTLVWEPIEGKWLSIDSAGGGENNEAYFKKFIGDDKIGKVYIITPGEERSEVYKRISRAADPWLPDYLEWYLLGRPMVDGTAMFGKVADLKLDGLPSNASVFLCAYNSGSWAALDATKSSEDGKAVFKDVGAQDVLYAVCTPKMTRFGKALLPIKPPFILKENGTTESTVALEDSKGESFQSEIEKLPPETVFTLLAWTKEGFKEVSRGRTDKNGIAHIYNLKSDVVYLIAYKKDGKTVTTRPFILE